MRLLTINAGSSSLKFATFKLGDAEPVCEHRGQLSGIGQGTAKLSGIDWATDNLKLENHRDAVALLLDRLEVAAVGHRVVHGGTRFTAPVTVDAATVAALRDLVPLAPLHQPHNVAAIEAVAAALPHAPQVACFDTAFHATMPEVAARFALPEKYWAQGIRRYGFHGLSYEAILHRLGDDVPSRLIVAHLGNGASLAAVQGGQCIATTMGFSTLDGLVMGTRAGLLDPGVILHLMRSEGLDRAGLEQLLYHQSGLLGVSAQTADMKTLVESDDPRASLAVEIYCYRIAREIGSLAAALQGLDALVFTGGVGENAAPIRARVTEAIRWLGDVDVRVIPTDEELTIARHTQSILQGRLLG
ncbi:acetate/propionate family kinase [Dongia sedimenti]|uniref:Acetate kinase n=1 Tax=Dongia sedimenti TaxID=3064282 RepID=A0ABU0YUT0_9PROT|nr:acetate/propionate family kinase [Rhodospirillaceae bacterium R-7]